MADWGFMTRTLVSFLAMIGVVAGSGGVGVALGADLSGQIQYDNSGFPVAGVTVNLLDASTGAPIVPATMTDSSGRYSFSGVLGRSFHVVPKKVGDRNNVISALDASYILQALGGTRFLSFAQLLAADVSGNGSASVLDASMILQLLGGSLGTLPVTQMCGSEWAFIPFAALGSNQQMIAPTMASPNCQMGTIVFQPLSAAAINQNFNAVAFGDVTENWQPAPAPTPTPAIVGPFITTVVGKFPVSSGTGDGLQANSAKIDPQSLVRDRLGNSFISDGAGNRIRRVDAVTNVITTIAGSGAAGFGGDGGPAIAATLNFPTGIALDTQGNVYFSDYRNHRVRRIDHSTGIITTVAGNGSTTYNGDGIAAASASLAYPNGLTFLADGSLLIADSFHLRVRRVFQGSNPSLPPSIETVAGTGSSLTPPGDALATQALLVSPVDVHVDGAGNYFITDQQLCRIFRVEHATKVMVTVAGGAGTGSRVCSVGHMDVSATSTTLSQPSRGVIDLLGNLYILEPFSIRVVSALTGIISSVANPGLVIGSTGDGGLPIDASFTFLAGLYVDPSSGDLYISDSGAGNVRRIPAYLLNPN